MNLEREKVKKKIAALLNKTVEQGASTEEALAASEKAAELMEVYDIEYGELEFKEKNITKECFYSVKYGQRFLVWYAAVGIAQLCQCRNWRSPHSGSMTYMGFKHDVEVAVHLHKYLERAAQTGLDDYKASAEFLKARALGENGRTLLSSWLAGFDGTLQRRLFELAEEREHKVETATGTSLVPLKQAEIDNEMREQGISISYSSVGSSVNSDSGYNAGKKAGSQINLSKAVGSKSGNGGLIG